MILDAPSLLKRNECTYHLQVIVRFPTDFSLFVCIQKVIQHSRFTLPNLKKADDDPKPQTPLFANLRQSWQAIKQNKTHNLNSL